MITITPLLFYSYRSKLLKNGITMSIFSETAINLIKLLPERLKDNHTVVIYHEKNNDYSTINKFAIFFHDFIIKIGKVEDIVDWEYKTEPIDICEYVKENYDDKFSLDLRKLKEDLIKISANILTFEELIRDKNYSQAELLCFSKVLTTLLIKQDEIQKEIDDIERYKINIINFK